MSRGLHNDLSSHGGGGIVRVHENNQTNPITLHSRARPVETLVCRVVTLLQRVSRKVIPFPVYSPPKAWIAAGSSCWSLCAGRWLCVQVSAFCLRARAESCESRRAACSCSQENKSVEGGGWRGGVLYPSASPSSCHSTQWVGRPR